MYNVSDYGKIDMYNLQIDRAIECVKKIVDNNRCAVCDKSDGHRVRYPCGHSACDQCFISTVDCLICLTPKSTSETVKPDDVSTQRAKNATSLLRACQDLFHTDVYTHQRLSEQLRIEKELFPQCIQAPMKYENKRKSLNSSRTKDKRRSSFFPGEGVSLMKENKMENSMSYVQKWLSNNDRNLSRKPFADLNVNQQSSTKTAKFKGLKRLTDDENKPLFINKLNKKRSHFKTTIKNECPVNRKRTAISPDSCPKKAKSQCVQPDNVNKYSKIQNKTYNDESGIVIDDGPIVIDDSQDTMNDKDRNAWLAVLEADKPKEHDSTSIRLDAGDCINMEKISSSNTCLNTQKLFTNVPFYKKSFLLETCMYCNNDNIKTNPTKKVKITIENNSFITTVDVFNTAVNNNDICKKTVAVQTGIIGMLHTNKAISMEDIKGTELDYKYKTEMSMQSQADIIQSEDLFTNECKNIPKKYVQKKCLVIEESDSDVDNDCSGPIHVTADIHRSCEEFHSGILAEVVDQEDHCARPRRGPRGHTPASTDSSEKENYNPNRIKRHRFGKKKGPKK